MNQIQPLKAWQIEQLPEFETFKGSVIVDVKDEDGNVTGKKLDLRNASANQLAQLLIYHFDVTTRNGRPYAYDNGRQILIDKTDRVTNYIDQIKSAYRVTKRISEKVTVATIMAILSDTITIDGVNKEIPHSFSSAPVPFVKWDGTPRAFYLLDNFFELNTREFDLDIDDETLKNQHRAGFMIWMMQHVAVIKGLREETNGLIGYSLIPILQSRAKEIGKTSFLTMLTNPFTKASIKPLSLLADSINLGREAQRSQHLIYDDIRATELAKLNNDVKREGTNQSYAFNQKYEPVIDVDRTTLYSATSNDSASEFANGKHESERRTLLLALLPKENPVDFMDFPFEQVWAELAVIVDSMPNDKLREVLRWGEDMTIQQRADSDDIVLDFIYELANDMYVDNPVTTEPMRGIDVMENSDVIETKKTGISSLMPDRERSDDMSFQFQIKRGEKSGHIIHSVTIEQIRRRAQGNKPVLDALHVSPKSSADGYEFDTTEFDRRIRPKIKEFSILTGQMEYVRHRTKISKRIRTFDVDCNEPLEYSDNHNENFNVEKINKLKDLFDKYSQDSKNDIERSIEEKKAFDVNSDSLDLNKLDNRLVVIRTNRYQNTFKETAFDELTDGTRQYYFWLTHKNAEYVSESLEKFNRTLGVAPKVGEYTTIQTTGSLDNITYSSNLWETKANTDICELLKCVRQTELREIEFKNEQSGKN